MTEMIIMITRELTRIRTSVRNARVIASNMLDAMVEADPVNADEYRRRHAELDRGLARMDSSMSARLAPLRGQGFMVWHPSLSYFARDYGLTQIALGGGGKEISLPGLMDRLRSVSASPGFYCDVRSAADGRIGRPTP